jgi:hypothetical protein
MTEAGTKVQFPEPFVTAVPSKVGPSYTETVDPASAEPEIDGRLEALLVEVTEGVAGAAVSIVIVCVRAAE